MKPFHALLLTAAMLIVPGVLVARSSADYLPLDAELNPAIPTPESVLGWEVGDWHVSHDRLVQYLTRLAEASPRVSIKTTGYTYEQRPLLQLAITSESNQQNLESLRQRHLDQGGPLVVWLGYSVHGDEPSGSNASLLVAYYLAASDSPFVNELLENSVVLIDPSVNPDGLNRFASWVNSNAGRVPVTDPATRQHVENWPESRTNHYLFDLNRDWLPLIHPESRARIAEFHRWRPHVLTDHHEQGRFPGFFFQPGVPSRQNPLTPEENLELTRALAEFHSNILDDSGQPHFTEDAFDDFYYGKGSTYPDINGSIGILFEQRAIQGQALATSNGIETFKMGVENQLLVSISTLRGAWALRDRLIRYQSGFDDMMQDRAASRNHRGWIVGDDGDPERARLMLEVFDLHGIEFLELAESVRIDGHDFEAGHAWVFPKNQPQFGLLEAMMEMRTTFRDETFYDVSAWTQPLAYNLPFATVNRLPSTRDLHNGSSGVALPKDATAYSIPWNQLQAAPLLQQLLDGGAKVRTALKPFSSQTHQGLVRHEAGSLVVQAGIQSPDQAEGILEILDRAALDGVRIYALQSSLTTTGPDLGSIHFPIIKPPRPLILGGKGTSIYEPGEAWFLLDQRLGMAAPMAELNQLDRVRLSEYTHILMQDGDYAALTKDRQEAIVDWVLEGGILVTASRAATWAENLCFGSNPDDCTSPERTEDESMEVRSAAYGDYADDRSQRVIGGAIVETRVDLTHPLAFGLRRTDLPILRRGTALLAPSTNPYATPVRYSAEPLLAGFVAQEQLDLMKGQPAVIAERQGKGLVVRFANNPIFRGFWRGTERLYVNAIYFGQVIGPTELPTISVPRQERN